MIAAQAAIRAWCNARASLTGTGNPLAGGVYLRQQRSPADGAYAVVKRVLGADDVVAELDGQVCTALLTFDVYSGGEDIAELAAAALASQFETLAGRPEQCPGTGVSVMVCDSIAGPVSIPQPPDSGEQYCFRVTAGFTLATL